MISGSGVEGKAGGHRYQLISQKAYGRNLDMDTPKGATLSILVENDDAIGAVALGDELKPTSKELIKALKRTIFDQLWQQVIMKKRLKARQ